MYRKQIHMMMMKKKRYALCTNEDTFDFNSNGQDDDDDGTGTNTQDYESDDSTLKKKDKKTAKEHAVFKLSFVISQYTLTPN
jgi:hypothetical protein